MQFNDTTNLTGIVQDVLFRTNTNVNEFTLKDIARFVNEGYNRVAYAILNADGRMQWDDSNHTDQPIALSTLTSGQQDYNIFAAAPTALQDWLMVDRVEVLNESDDWVLLNPIDKHDINSAIGEYSTQGGVPSSFDFTGSQVLLYPTPDYTVTSGLKIYFNRAPSYFASTNTTKRPGFATIFHEFLSIFAAHQWNITKKNDASLQPMLDKIEFNIGQFYSKRNKVETPVLSRAYETYK